MSDIYTALPCYNPFVKCLCLLVAIPEWEASGVALGSKTHNKVANSNNVDKEKETSA